MSEERPIKIWGQEDSRAEASGAEKNGAEKNGPDDASPNLKEIRPEEIPGNEGQDTTRKVIKPLSRRKIRKEKEKKARIDYKKRAKEIRQMNNRERLESLKYYLSTYRGRRMVTCIIILVLVAMGLSHYMKNADLREGLKLCQEGRYVDAQVPLKNAVDRDNMNPAAYNALGMAYLGSGEYEDALKQFELASNLDPANQDTLRGMGITFYKTGDYEEAVNLLSQALDLCGINVNETEYDIMWYRAAAETAMKDYEAAEYTYSALMELEGDTASLRYHRGDVYCRMNEKDKALLDFDEAISKEGNSFDLYFDIYNSLNSRGWHKDADLYLGKCSLDGAIDTQGMRPADYNRSQGMILYLKGDYRQAVELLSDIELTEDFQAQSYKALCLERLGKNKQAQAIYQQMVKTYPKNAEAYNRFALYLMRRGKGAKAASYLQQGIDHCLAADQKVLYYNLVTVYEQMGDYESAQEALQEYGSLYDQRMVSHEKSFAKERNRS